MPSPSPCPIEHAIPLERPPAIVLRSTTARLGPGEIAPPASTNATGIRLVTSTAIVIHPQSYGILTSGACLETSG